MTDKKFTRKQVWAHNALVGRCKMAETGMQAIRKAPTTTDECRQDAIDIEYQLKALVAKLRAEKRTPE